MKNEFPISNLRAKYADKTADGKDIAEAIAEAQLAASIPELTNDTAGDIFNTKPKFIKYGTMFYVLEDFGTDTLCYSSCYEEYIYTISIEHTGNTYSFEENEYGLVTVENKGTKLYKHVLLIPGSITPSGITGNATVTLISTGSEKITEIGFAGDYFIRYSKTVMPAFTALETSNSTRIPIVLSPRGSNAFKILYLSSGSYTDLITSNSAGITDTVTPL